MRLLKQKELVEVNGGGWFSQGSFLDVFATAVSSEYRDFKAFLREQGVL